MSWLLASISECTFSHISKCDTANVIWQVLEEYFMTESKVRIVKLESNLQSLKKRSLSVHEYARRMKVIVEALGASGHV